MAMHDKNLTGSQAQQGARGFRAGSIPAVASKETNKEKPA